MKPDRFSICWPITLAQECPLPDDWSNVRNFSNDAHDPGGATMCGITQREYDVFRKSKGQAPQSVRFLTPAEGEEIGESSYWLPECPKLPAGLDMCYFDEAFNAGSYAATRLLQRVLDVEADGRWGPLTDLAVKGLGRADISAAVRSYTTQREAFYRSLAGFPYFGNGWLARCMAIQAAALKMV